MTPKIHVVCSDQARNGKTLLARLIADDLTLVGREPAVFDAECPLGGIRAYLPERTRLVDLTRTNGQMAMIDTMLGSAPRDYVIDLSCRLLADTFALFEQIDFIGEARKAGFVVIVLYIIDRPFASLRLARQIYHGGQLDRFVPVRNDAIGHVSDYCQVVNLYGELIRGGEIFLPVLSRDILRMAEQRGFSFASFLLNRYPHITAEKRAELRQFLNAMFAQIRQIHGEVEFQGLRRMGLV
jgi:hypothetical protein